ncbi:hypothetical protein [Bradyrhizobium sp. AUGA SZCCT0160]|uniref:hypothetical protein n=1 Tax=Bradyrhizobium sp. AUGA SZCCT0160 TaxID=2807662 RepID=UPI001BA77559|nr:hypothetical protein [Bradyrhizobium sp. AUGA SZCCT0160]MBR1191683.1 hypothetical protein [Bradyrhizobium sp. AUGA SZCCT0160]
MNAITAPKSPSLNRLEGMTLTALLQAMPTYAAAAMLLKLAGSAQIVSPPRGAVIFVVIASFFHALIVPWLAPKYPKLFKASYEPLFFDASLSFSEKVLRWRTQPMASLQLLTSTVMLSLLAVAMLSAG